MALNRGVRYRVMDTRLFEDDMDSIRYDEPADDDSGDKFDDDPEIQFWLKEEEKRAGLLQEFWDDLRGLWSKFWGGVTRPFADRAQWAGSSFLELGYSKNCLPFFIIFVFVAMYFGTLLHETLHIAAAAMVNEVPVGIRLNGGVYSVLGSGLSTLTGGFVQNADLASGNPGSAIILATDNPWHTAFIGIFPNIIMFMMGFAWLRKGLNERNPVFFGAGLVFSCSNLEIFVPSLHTDVTATSAWVASIIGVTGNDIGAVTMLIAAAVLGTGYALSVAYDRWQKGLVERHGKDSARPAAQKTKTPKPYPA